MFKCFLLAGVCYISYGGFQTKVYKIGGCYSVRETKVKKSWFFAKTQWIVYLWGLSVFIYVKTMGS
jgi:hypothetical protein